jgi:hypothetical protein
MVFLHHTNWIILADARFSPYALPLTQSHLGRSFFGYSHLGQRSHQLHDSPRRSLLPVSNAPHALRR